MSKNHAIVAVFSGHNDVERAISRLSEGGLDIKHFSIVGKGYHKEEQVLGFYNSGDRMLAWGGTGAFWGGLWGLFVGGLMMTVPLVGPVIVLGHFAAMVFAAAEGAVIVGSLGVLGGAMSSLGIPKDSVIQYETALKTDSFLLMAHGPVEEIARAKAILDTMSPNRIDLHRDVHEMADAMPSQTPVASLA